MKSVNKQTEKNLNVKQLTNLQDIIKNILAYR